VPQTPARREAPYFATHRSVEGLKFQNQFQTIVLVAIILYTPH
jgi:hypothetical protein